MRRCRGWERCQKLVAHLNLEEVVANKLGQGITMVNVILKSVDELFIFMQSRFVTRVSVPMKSTSKSPHHK
jgi:hypothetical protein